METAKPQARSGFVSTLAWTFIVFAAFGTLVALLQNIMLAAMFPAEELQATLREAEQDIAIPDLVKFLFANMRLLVALFMVTCLLTLGASIGLLMRKNWARLAFIVLMALGIVSNLAGAVLPFFLVSSMGELAKNAPPDVKESMDLMMNVSIAFTAVVSLVFAALFAWIARRLMSREVRAEFFELRD